MHVSLKRHYYVDIFLQLNHTLESLRKEIKEALSPPSTNVQGIYQVSSWCYIHVYNLCMCCREESGRGVDSQHAQSDDAGANRDQGAAH